MKKKMCHKCPSCKKRFRCGSMVRDGKCCLPGEIGVCCYGCGKRDVPMMTGREISAVLAGLRLLQARAENVLGNITNTQFFEDIVTNGGEFKALDTGEIEALCQRINK